MKTFSFLVNQIINLTIMGAGIAITLYGVHSFEEESGWNDYMRMRG